MAKFSIECTQSLGMSHHGEVIAEGESTVDLTDEEVKTLVKLIREKDTTDVDELELEENYPDLYEKLQDAYRAMAYRAEETHWLWEGYNNSYFEYDTNELMDYCEEELGFTFEFKPEEELDDYELEDYNEDPESFEDVIYDAKCEAFYEWLDEYVHSLSDDEACSFFVEHMNADLSLDNVSYEVGIPAAIIEMAEE